MRYLTDHLLQDDNEHLVDPDQLTICVSDDPGPGGANHRYEIQGMDLSKNPHAPFAKSKNVTGMTIVFQNGTVQETGVNGLTNEVLLAIVADRLKGFQGGKYACLENAEALEHVGEALNMLHSRTRERMYRGVEGVETATAHPTPGEVNVKLTYTDAAGKFLMSSRVYFIEGGAVMAGKFPTIEEFGSTLGRTAMQDHKMLAVVASLRMHRGHAAEEE